MYPWPKYSTVTCAELRNQDSETADSNSGKRSRWSSPEASRPAAQKKARSRPPDETDDSDFGSDEDADEVEEMVIDESFSQKPRSSRRSNSTGRQKINRTRLDRWAKNKAVSEKQVRETAVPAEGSFSMRVDSDGAIPSQTTSSSSKRKGRLCSSLLPSADVGYRWLIPGIR